MRLDLANNDVVVPAIMDFTRPTIESGQYAGQYRHPVLGNTVFDAVVASVVGPCEMLGYVLLPGGEHVNSETFGVEVGLQ